MSYYGTRLSMVQNLLWIIIFLSNQSSSTGEDCLKSGNSSECCADFFMKEGKCTPCPNGYIGPNCDFTCPYPSYGRRCVEGDCECPKELCNPETGCAYQPTTQNYFANVSFEKSTSAEENDLLFTEQKNKYSGDNIDSKKSKSSSTAVVVISVFCTLIIISLVIVIVLQMKGKLLSHNKILLSKRRSRVISQRHVDTYCEIDEKNMEITESNKFDEVEIYESIDHSNNKNEIKYTELPTRKGVSNEERKLMSTILMTKILDDDGNINNDIQHHSKSEEKQVNRNETIVQMRKDKVDLDTFSKRKGKTSSNISGYIDMGKKDPKEYVSMNAENIGL
ncbi:uncharacterized protein [Magallana gigas]|uniref:uncharacterized protein isoform X2 n=1 Tax=Magallana gigas TaxID=29159 RepID=UPI003341EE51